MRFCWGGIIWRRWHTPVKQPAFSVLTLVLVMYCAAITGLCMVVIALEGFILPGPYVVLLVLGVLAGLLSAVGPSLLPPTPLSWGRCLALFCFGLSCWAALIFFILPTHALSWLSPSS